MSGLIPGVRNNGVILVGLASLPASTQMLVVTAAGVIESTASGTFTSVTSPAFTIGSGQLFAFTGQAYTTPSTGSGIAAFVNSSGANSYGFAIGGNTLTLASGSFSKLFVGGGFSPTSGTAVLACSEVSPTINQTGGASGITRGYWAIPTLTAAADWRSFESANNSGWAFYGAGTAASRFGGSVAIVGNVGFYGTTPVAKQSLPASPTAAQIATVLSNLGLVTLT